MSAKQIGVSLLSLALGVFGYVEFGIAENRVAPPVVVSATKIETPITGVGSTVTVITEAEIEQRQTYSLPEILREVPAVDVVQSGANGGDAAVFIRGANPEHTLVLVDGVEMNDPIRTARALNFSTISLENVERVEVLRGPQGTLYGSEALGGVINIITKRGSGDPSVTVRSEVGSYDTYREQLSSSGGNDLLDYSFAFSREDTNGISANDNPAGKAENDSFANTAWSSRVGFAPIEQLSLSGMLRIYDSNSDIDNGPGAGLDDPNRHFKSDRQFYRVQADTNFFDGGLKQIAGLSYSDQSFEDNNDPDPQHPLDSQRSNFDSSILKLDLQNTVPMGDVFTLVFGAEHEEEKASSFFHSESEFGPFESTFPNRSSDSNGYYVQLTVDHDSGFASAFGIRVDHYSAFDEEVTWRIAPTYLIEETGTRFRTTVGTGFRAPSLFQRFSEFGRPDLEPEESIGVDAGVDQSFFDELLTLGFTYFYNDFDNLITFDPNTFLFENVAAAVTQGAEISAAVRPLKALELATALTILDAEDTDTGLSLVRRAKYRLTSTVRYAYEDLRIMVTALTVGERPDNDFSTFPTERVTLPEYTVLNLAADYSFGNGFELFARVENLLDTEYEDVIGYNTLGASAFIGLKWQFEPGRFLSDGDARSSAAEEATN